MEEGSDADKPPGDTAYGFYRVLIHSGPVFLLVALILLGILAAMLLPPFARLIQVAGEAAP